MNYIPPSLGIPEQVLVPLNMKRLMAVQCILIGNISP